MNSGETPGRLDGVRVLLAEDNPVYRSTACNLLRAAGATVVQAENGLQAIELALHGGIDLVLMDLNMPVLSGIDATRAIRSDPRGSSLPILAMTAEDSATARVATTACGMDAHLAKSLLPAQLLAAVARFAPARAGNAPPPPVVPQQQARSQESIPLPELAGIDTATLQQRNPGDSLRLRRVLRTFQRDFCGCAESIGAAIVERRFADAFQAAHRLKSAAMQIGALELSQAAAGVEAAARNGAVPETALLDTLRGESRRVLDALQGLEQGPTAALARPLDVDNRATARILCDVLGPLIAAGNTGAWDVLESLERLLAGTSLEPDVRQLAEEFDELELPRADLLRCELRQALEGGPAHE